MTDYSSALIDARKQLANAEAAAALHDWALARDYAAKAVTCIELMRESLKELGAPALAERQNAQRAM